MKSVLLYFALPLAMASPVDKRQIPGFDLANIDWNGMFKSASSMASSLMENINIGGLMTTFMPTMAVVKVESMTPQIRQDAKRLKIVHGPFKIKGTQDKSRIGNSFSMDPSGTGYYFAAGQEIPRDITLLYSKTDIVDKELNRVDVKDGLYNHHNVWMAMGGSSMGTPMAACSPNGFSMPGLGTIMSGGTDGGDLRFTDVKGKLPSGFYIGKNDGIGNMIDVVNYNNDTKEVWQLSEIEYLPGKIPNLMPVSRQVLGIGMCTGLNSMDIRPPPGKSKFTLEGGGIHIVRDGFIVHAKGHLHDGGVNLVIQVNDKSMCDSRVIYGGEGLLGQGNATIQGTTICPDTIPVKKGDIVKIVANYDLELHPSREHVKGGSGGGMMGMMGMMGGGSGASKPAAGTASPAAPAAPAASANSLGGLSGLLGGLGGGSGGLGGLLGGSAGGMLSGLLGGSEAEGSEQMALVLLTFAAA